MIMSKKDYIEYLIRDKFQLNVKQRKERFTNNIYRFQILLRKTEYFVNCRKDFVGKLYSYLLRYRLKRKRIKYGFSIPINVFGPGLSIAHIGTIVINDKVKIGSNCRIHVCTNIGADYRDMNGVPLIGDDVYIGPGAKIFGNIVIGNKIIIGANAVVNKSFEENGSVIAGVPAKLIRVIDSEE